MESGTMEKEAKARGCMGASMPFGLSAALYDCGWLVTQA